MIDQKINLQIIIQKQELYRSATSISTATMKLQSRRSNKFKYKRSKLKKQFKICKILSVSDLQLKNQPLHSKINFHNLKLNRNKIAQEVFSKNLIKKVQQKHSSHLKLRRNKISLTRLHKTNKTLIKVNSWLNKMICNNKLRLLMQ